MPARGRPVHFTRERSDERAGTEDHAPKNDAADGHSGRAAVVLAVLCSRAHAAPEPAPAGRAVRPQRRVAAAGGDPRRRSPPSWARVLVDDPASAEGVLSVARGEHGRIVDDLPAAADDGGANGARADRQHRHAGLAGPGGRQPGAQRSAGADPPPAGDPRPRLPPLFPPAPRRRAGVAVPAETAEPVCVPNLVPPFPPRPARAAAAVRQAARRTAQIRSAAPVPHDGRRLWHGPVPGHARDQPELPGWDRLARCFISGAHRVAGYHVAPEIGFLWRPDILLGAQLRLQHVLGATEVHHPSCGSSGVCHPPSTAVALLGRAGWLRPLGETRPPADLRGGGLGRVRHLVSLAGIGRRKCGPTGKWPLQGHGGQRPAARRPGRGAVLPGSPRGPGCSAACRA